MQSLQLDLLLQHFHLLSKLHVLRVLALPHGVTKLSEQVRGRSREQVLLRTVQGKWWHGLLSLVEGGVQGATSLGLEHVLKIRVACLTSAELPRQVNTRCHGLAATAAAHGLVESGEVISDSQNSRSLLTRRAQGQLDFALANQVALFEIVLTGDADDVAVLVDVVELEVLANLTRRSQLENILKVGYQFGVSFNVRETLGLVVE